MMKEYDIVCAGKRSKLGDIVRQLQLEYFGVESWKRVFVSDMARYEAVIEPGLCEVVRVHALVHPLKQHDPYELLVRYNPHTHQWLSSEVHHGDADYEGESTGTARILTENHRLMELGVIFRIWTPEWTLSGRFDFRR